MQCDQIWRNFAALPNFLTSLAMFEGVLGTFQNFEPSLGDIFAIGLIFHCCKWPNFEQII